MDYISGWCRSERRLDGVTVIVTGANGGIGRETTADLFARGARVIMACRNTVKAEVVRREIICLTPDDQNKGTIVLEELDLCSLTSVQRFAEKILATENRIQILINNAGVMCCPESKTEDGFETHMGSNHLGHAYLTFLLLPRMVENAPSRIIFVTSAIHYFHRIDFEDFNNCKTPYSPWTAYSRSKIANIMFVKALAQKVEENNIKGVNTYSVHPGIVNTDIDRHICWLLSRLYHLSLVRWMWKSPQCGAQTTIYCAVDESCADESGLYYSDCSPCLPSSHCQNDANIAKLWDLTIELLKRHNKDIDFLFRNNKINKA